MHQDQEDIIVNIPFIIHMIFEMALQILSQKCITILLPEIFIWFFEVFLRQFFLFSQKTMFFFMGS